MLAIFREYDPRYPQLSTRRQLGISMMFAVVMGIYTFLRKHFPLEYRLKDNEVK